MDGKNSYGLNMLDQKGRGAYWGRKTDTKGESSKVQHKNAKQVVRLGLSDSGF